MNDLRAKKLPVRSTSSRITHDEQQELLRMTAELQRIRQVQEETALKSPNLKLSTLALSRASGYGDDMHVYEIAITEGHSARDTLVTRNMGLVYYCVNEILGKRKRFQSLSREDLVQEGAIGLARAVDRYNLAIGGRFSSYAMYWIQTAVLRGIAEQDDLVRVPEHVSAAVRKMSKAANRLGIDIDGKDLLPSVQSSVWSSDSSWKEALAAKALSEEAGLTDRQLQEAMKVKRRRRNGVLSFEAWMQQGKTTK